MVHARNEEEEEEEEKEEEEEEEDRCIKVIVYFLKQTAQQTSWLFVRNVNVIKKLHHIIIMLTKYQVLV